MQRIRSPGTLWKSNNRFCICSLFHLMISTSLLLPLIIGNVAVGGTTIPIGNRMIDVISIYPVSHINYFLRTFQYKIHNDFYISESVEDELTALGDQSTSDVLEQENDQMVDPEYSQGIYQIIQTISRKKCYFQKYFLQLCIMQIAEEGLIRLRNSKYSYFRYTRATR